MQNLDYSILQPLSANNHANKTNKAEDNENCKKELEKYLNNFREFMLNQSVYDMTSLLIAEQDWIKRHSKQQLFSESLVGKIIRVDFGKTYLCENGFVHYAVCIAENQGKYCVIPMTTANDEIKMAYHPSFRPTGEKRLYLLKKTDGNSKDSALYINDLKFISSGRIIKVGGRISDVAYNNIVELVCEVVLEDLHKKLMSLNTSNAALEEKVALLELLCRSLQNN